MVNPIDNLNPNSPIFSISQIFICTNCIVDTEDNVSIIQIFSGFYTANLPEEREYWTCVYIRGQEGRHNITIQLITPTNIRAILHEESMYFLEKSRDYYIIRRHKLTFNDFGDYYYLVYLDNTPLCGSFITVKPSKSISA